MKENAKNSEIKNNKNNQLNADDLENVAGGEYIDKNGKKWESFMAYCIATAGEKK